MNGREAYNSGHPRPGVIREDNDYYATDPLSIDKLFEVEEFSNSILEPSAGRGHMSYRMSEKGKDVLSCDLIDRGQNFEIEDFLLSNRDWDGDIITNPPFKIVLEFYKKGYDLLKEGRKMAFFVKLVYLEGIKRGKFYRDHPPKKIYVFSRRIVCVKGAEDDHDFTKDGSMTAYCWIIWEKGYEGPTILDWI